MNESAWNVCADPDKMLGFLRDSNKRTERKARLFAVACCQRIWPLLTDDRSKRAVEVAERYADAAAYDEELAGSARAAVEVYRGRRLDVDFSYAAYAAVNAADPFCV